MRPAVSLPVTRPITQQRGLTLLELLLVVSILSGVAFMSVSFLGDGTSQLRFDDTKNRLDAVRKAILGQPERSINGQAEIRGYVADMGNLPLSLQALIVQNYCTDPLQLNAADCVAAGHTWVTQPAYIFDTVTDTGLWAGWNGPYLAASPESDYAKYRDGWGYDDATNNFGWVYTLSTDARLEMQSLGMDSLAGGTLDYEADYPPVVPPTLIAANAYRTLITDSVGINADDESGGLTIDFGSPAPCWRCSNGTSITRFDCELAAANWFADTTITDSGVCIAAPGQWEPTENICLRIAYRENGALVEMVSSGANGEHNLTWNASAQTALFAFEDEIYPHDVDSYLPQGLMAFRVFEHNGTACTTNEYPRGSPWKLFSLTPRTQIQPLQWAVN